MSPKPTNSPIEAMDTVAKAKANPRPGGRSARVQAAVHIAVQALQQETGREGLTVPVIAARAGVTPSTIYRRWGDLNELLADVAIEQLRPDQDPEDTGSFLGDLRAWLYAYFEEMSSAPGRAMLRDVLGTLGGPQSGMCVTFIEQQLDVISERAQQRHEAVLANACIIDRVIAPLIYRLLFSHYVPQPQDVDEHLATVVASASSAQ